MRRLAPLLGLLLAGVFLPGWAADFGLVLDNQSGWSSFDDPALLQRDRATAWFSTPLGAIVDLYASLRLDYNLDPKPSWFGPSSFGVDVGRLELTVANPGSPGQPLAWSVGAGRFDYAFLSEGVFSGRLDGLKARIAAAGAEYRFALGYLGLLPKEELRTLLSADDVADFDAVGVFFAPPRLIGEAEIALVELFARQDLSIGIGAQFDLRGWGPMPSAEFVHTQYLSFLLEGALARNLFHKAHADLALGESTPGAFVMAAAGYSISLYLPQAARSRLQLLVEYASGKTGFLSIWRPISTRQMGFVYNVSFADCLSTTLEASFSPFKSLTTGVKASFLHRTSAEALLDTSFDAASDDAYLGTEADLYAVFEPGADLSLSLTGGVFVPAAGGSYLPGTPARWLVSATLTLSL